MGRARPRSAETRLLKDALPYPMSLSPPSPSSPPYLQHLGDARVTLASQNAARQFKHAGGLRGPAARVDAIAGRPPDDETETIVVVTALVLGTQLTSV